MDRGGAGGAGRTELDVGPARPGTSGDPVKIRAQFAGSRWPDLRTADTAYVDLVVQLRTARGTDGYQTIWFSQRLDAACAKHGRPLNGST